MTAHIKDPKESMAHFRKRVLAWNEGEPVPEKAETVRKTETVHKFYGDWTFCMKPHCYAKKEAKRNSQSCPQSIDYISNPILRRLFGWMVSL